MEAGGIVGWLGPWLKSQVVRPVIISFPGEGSVGKWFSPRESPAPATKL